MYLTISTIKNTNKIIIVYLLESNVNAINNTPIQTRVVHVLYENKYNLHKLKYNQVIKQVKSQFSKKI